LLEKEAISAREERKVGEACRSIEAKVEEVPEECEE
jgi:hypothetical protein